MGEVLAVGRYDAKSAEAIEKLGWRVVPTILDAAEGGEDSRRGVRAIAYLGSHAFGGDQMDRFPDLGVIANYGVGYDAIDVDAATARGIKVTNTPDVLSDDVADLAMAMLLDVLRDTHGADRHVRSGDWGQKGRFPLQSTMTGRKVGIVGLGRIGSEIADRCAAFKTDVHYWSRSRKDAPAAYTYHDDALEMMREIDIAIIALVGGAETEGFVTKEMIEALGPDGVLVNISRGTTIDENAMIEALRDGRLGGAGLDVFLNEPHVDERFRDLPNAVLQPHQASATIRTRAEMGRLQRENILAFLGGDPLPTAVN